MPKHKNGGKPRGRLLGRPFGNPEGASASLNDVLDDFVEFEGVAPDDALAANAHDSSTRVLVGKKGVGKTVYLRRFQAAAVEDVSTYADHVRRDLPDTQLIINVSQSAKRGLVEEHWARIWRCAIVRATISHVLCADQLKDRDEASVLEERVADYPSLLSLGRRPRSVYSEVLDIASNKTSDQLTRYVGHKDWRDLEGDVTEALRTLPPLFFYLDDMDDYFAAAPMFWLKCHKGLVRTIQSLLKEDGFRRLHVVACVRDLVLSSLLRDEHADRVRGEPHIRVLDWDYPAIRYFLHRKIRSLPQRYLMKPDATEPIEMWLGTTEIYNGKRGAAESLEHYLLRHTRLIPRDIVWLGNLLCDRVSQARHDGAAVLDDRAIWEVVDKAARGFADDQLRACANQIAADQVPEHGGPRGYADFYVGTSEYREGIVGELRQLISALGFDRVSEDTLKRGIEDISPTLQHEHVLDVLWQNGVLGYDTRVAGCSHFYSATEADDFNLPQGRLAYVFHPCLAHRIELEPSGPPVQAFPPT